MKPKETRLAAHLDFSAERTPSPAALAEARRLLQAATLPATVATLSRVGFGRDRQFVHCLPVLEARGEVTLNARGDAVFSIAELAT